MAKPTAWMPMYWGDYLRDTGHLTTGQHGAYLLLIAHYWVTGKALPDDDARLSKIVRAQGVVWARLKPTLSAFFKVENGRWYHERIERELSEAFDRKDAAIKRGKNGAATRWGHRASIDQAIVEHSNHSHSHINHDSESENHTGAARDPALNGGSGPRARRAETSKERLARLAMDSRLKLLRKGEA